MNNTQIEEYINKFPILRALPKNCGCTICLETKNEIKKQVGDKVYYKICEVLHLL